MLKVAAYFCKLISEQNKFLGREKTMIRREKRQSFSINSLNLHELIYIDFFDGYNTTEETPRNGQTHSLYSIIITSK